MLEWNYRNEKSVIMVQNITVQNMHLSAGDIFSLFSFPLLVLQKLFAYSPTQGGKANQPSKSRSVQTYKLRIPRVSHPRLSMRTRFGCCKPPSSRALEKEQSWVS